MSPVSDQASLSPELLFALPHFSVPIALAAVSCAGFSPRSEPRIPYSPDTPVLPLFVRIAERATASPFPPSPDPENVDLM